MFYPLREARHQLPVARERHSREARRLRRRTKEIKCVLWQFRADASRLGAAPEPVPPTAGCARLSHASFFPSVDKRQVTFKRAREYECCKNTRRGRRGAGRTNAADSAPPIIPRFPASCVLSGRAANVCARAKSSFRRCVHRLSPGAPSLAAARPISRIRRLKLGRSKGGGFLPARGAGRAD